MANEDFQYNRHFDLCF